ncbi:Ino4p KNAG_0K00550 [Huiozyma naganishii CBS 8797]|uniref:BHLH domain-containing protein n=1 Tax=Huiozyma naganishii (strain ATCC MYA-139 / BCRC 22969 / CBS 8797 / KCTC 17520 / NBRC 10181 / NCYC 3082 / Yp74L-3) TaxID=1071383 RepID=J7RRD5_HUIN7|nr:hypothetical protein KNAG_0K00550 [Kazachstania naganishii CBS 8797]CCK72423.1 hypothetical protein KNAG_0K00550 [Kazachstania naganishii CBS 8797]
MDGKDEVTRPDDTLEGDAAGAATESLVELSDGNAIADSIPWISSNGSGKIQKPGRRPRAKKVNKLSQDQVRINHISSEKKRREVIRSIYDELVLLVPDLDETENRSELVIYLKTINYLKWLYDKNATLRSKIQQKGNTGGNEQNKEIDEELIWELETESKDPS